MVCLLLSVCTRAQATPQMADKLVEGDSVYWVYPSPLSDYLSDHANANIFPQPWTTMNWKGYSGSWEIRGKKLYLTEIRCRDSITNAMGRLFPGATNGVAATWFSGRVSSPELCLRYVHGGVGGDHAYWVHFDFWEGVLTERSWEIDPFAFYMAVLAVNIAAVLSLVLLATKSARKRAEPVTRCVLTSRFTLVGLLDVLVSAILLSIAASKEINTLLHDSIECGAVDEFRLLVTIQSVARWLILPCSVATCAIVMGWVLAAVRRKRPTALD